MEDQFKCQSGTRCVVEISEVAPILQPSASRDCHPVLVTCDRPLASPSLQPVFCPLRQRRQLLCPFCHDDIIRGNVQHQTSFRSCRYRRASVLCSSNVSASGVCIMTPATEHTSHFIPFIASSPPLVSSSLDQATWCQGRILTSQSRVDTVTRGARAIFGLGTGTSRIDQCVLHQHNNNKQGILRPYCELPSCVSRLRHHLCLCLGP